MLFLCDKVMDWLQHTFVSTENIEIEEDVWDFKYSPAVIFSGTVQALDINFIKPNKDVRNMNNMDAFLESKKEEYKSKAVECDWDMYVSLLEEIKKHEYQKRTEEITEYHIGRVATFDYYGYVEGEYFYGYFLAEWYDDAGETYSYYKADPENIDDMNTISSYKSTAEVLQGTIATWYNVLRRIALVGLLSVLVYIGIVMVLSSSSQDKAKYKAMMKDWLIAICLLFTLHYIMSITITITNEISDIFQTGESDQLLNTLRKEIFSESDSGIILAKTIMYAVLVILTVAFTIQYLKRVIFMAFYTLIAPLITLTYPLDKIKDGQAQAFTMWIREYVYTALIQVIHLVIYTVLVGSALDLVSHYPLYAIIVLLFIKKADGIIKKMFGFDKSETVGTLGAAATGALIVNALNKIARKRCFKKERRIRSFRRN